MQAQQSSQGATKTDRNIKFKQELTKIKQEAINKFDEILALDANSKPQREKGIKIAEEIKEKLDELCQLHLEPTDEEIENQEYKKQQLADLEIALEEIGGHKEWDVIGGGWTSLAVKSSSSYIIGTWGRSIKVIENLGQVFSGKLPVAGTGLTDVVYIKHLDCYLLDHNNQVFRKDVDDKPPYLFMDLRCGWRAGGSFRYSSLHNRLVVAKDCMNIAVINLEDKEIELEVEKKVGCYIYDFRLFGDQEDQMVALTSDGYLLLYQLEFGAKTGSLVSDFKIDLKAERKELGASLAVCTNNEYILVELAKYLPSICSRMVVFQIKGNEFIQKAKIDMYTSRIGEKLALDCYGYIEGHIVWVGLSKGKTGVVQVFDYDLEDEEILELEKKRKPHEGDDVLKMDRLGNQFYYTGKNGSVMRLSLNL